MDWIQASIIALIQGITEFLPISSSAHLLFPSLLLGWPDQGLSGLTDEIKKYLFKTNSGDNILIVIILLLVKFLFFTFRPTL